MSGSAPIAVVDYGMGNLRSVQKGLEKVGARVEVTSDPDRIRSAAGVVLPGVGAFGACMANLEARGLVEPLLEVLGDGRPFLGICLGLQLLFEESEELGPVRGLGFLRGRCVRFEPAPERPVPHMGWNQLTIRRRVPLLEGIDSGAWVYFVHSYHAVPEEEGVTAATADYGLDFAAVVARDHVFACQFHPEKSQRVGLRVLANFARMVGQ